MHLNGVPEAVLVDAGARDAEVDRLLEALPLTVVPAGAHGATLGPASVGVFARDRPPVPGCYAWYVGAGPCPAWMHPAPRGAALVLALLGTALAQERAGAAFRAAGRGEPVPTAVDVDGAGLLAGVSRAVGPVVPGPARSFAWSDGARDRLLEEALTALERCCAPSGAIAAAPPRTSPEDPDYSFFWQRDAAAAAFALLGLVERGPVQLRPRAQARLSAYTDFVERLGRGGHLSASRCTLTGEVVGGYGDPQHDGPAATALVLLRVRPAAAQPYLEHLRRSDGIGYDLWELVHGRSAHAARLRQRALGEQSAWVPGRHVLDADPAWFQAVSGLDTSSIGCEVLGARSVSGAAGPTLARLEQAFADRWPVNVAWRRSGRLGHGMGRFPEDGNDGLGTTGGHPWPVATLWAAQWHLLRGEDELGRGFLDFVLAHGGGRHEQIDGTTGEGRGAPGLAWSAAELVSAVLLLPA